MTPLSPNAYWAFQIISIIISAIAAVAIAYGVFKTKQRQFENDLRDLKVGFAEHQKVYQNWVSDRKHSLRTTTNCHEIRTECQAKFYNKLDKLITKYEKNGKEYEKRWNRLSSLLGAICARMKIEIPNLNV